MLVEPRAVEVLRLQFGALDGLDWVGLWLALEVGSHGQCVLPSPVRLGPTLAVGSHNP